MHNLKEIRNPISINDHTTIKLEMTIKKSILHFTLRKIKINSLKSIKYDNDEQI